MLLDKDQVTQTTTIIKLRVHFCTKRIPRQTKITLIFYAAQCTIIWCDTFSTWKRRKNELISSKKGMETSNAVIDGSINGS